MTGSLERITEAGYRRVQATYQGYIDDDRKRREAIKAKAAAGEELSERDRAMLKRAPMRVPDRFAPVRRYFSDDEWAKVGGDELAIRTTLNKRLPYMRSQGWYELVVDKELQQFGVANNDPALLDKAIAALLSADRGTLARTLLARYTDQSFATAAEWSAWLRDHRERLFFTEAGGYKWLVDTTGQARNEKPTAALATSTRRAVEPVREVLGGTLAATSMQPAAEPSAKHPLVARLRIESSEADRHQASVEVSILDGWHAYGSLPAGSPYTELSASLQLPDGLVRQGDWQRPLGSPYPSDPGMNVFEGSVVLRCVLVGALPKDLADVVCTLSYQVCDDSMCMPPSELELAASSVKR